MNIKELFEQKKWMIYGIAIFVGFSMGIIIPLATAHMTNNHVGGIWIGVISSSYFLFMALGSVFVDKKLKGQDVKTIVIAGLLLTACCSVLFPLAASPFIWFLLMSIMGMGISSNMVGIQTALHHVSDESTLAVVSGIYTLCFALGFIASSVIGPQIYEYIFWLPFTIGAIGLVLASLLVNGNFRDELVIPKHLEEKVLHKITLALFGAFLYGFSETTVISLYPLFLLREHVALSQIGYGLGVFVAGGILGTIPLTYLADRIGREKCLTLSVFVSIFVVVGLIISNGFYSRQIFSFVAGFTMGPVYPLSLALLVQDLGKKEIPSGTALFTFFYGFGSAAGPLFSSIAMDVIGNRQIFSFSLLLFFSFLIYTFVRRKKIGTGRNKTAEEWKEMKQI